MRDYPMGGLGVTADVGYYAKSTGPAMRMAGETPELTREDFALQIDAARLAVRQAELQVKRWARPAIGRAAVWNSIHRRRAELDVESAKIVVRQIELSLEEFEENEKAIAEKQQLEPAGREAAE
jgi:hypothetical protein